MRREIPFREGGAGDWNLLLPLSQPQPLQPLADVNMCSGLSVSLDFQDLHIWNNMAAVKRQPTIPFGSQPKNQKPVPLLE